MPVPDSVCLQNKNCCNGVAYQEQHKKSIDECTSKVTAFAYNSWWINQMGGEFDGLTLEVVAIGHNRTSK